MSSSATLSLLPPVPALLLETFEEVFAVQQQEQRRLWQLAAYTHKSTPFNDQEFVADEFALLMDVHPATARSFLVDAVNADDLPALMGSWEAQEMTDRHVRAAVEELHRCLDDHDLRTQALDRVLTRCRERTAKGAPWPRPGELQRMIQAAALLLDKGSRRLREQKAKDGRGAHCYSLPNGQAGFALDGPAEEIIAAADAVRDRALAASKVPGETRTLAQLEFDLTVELLINGTADGSEAQVGVEVQVIVPVDTITADAEELGELVGHGPISPERARDLTGRATTLRRIDVDRLTGRVVGVGDAMPVRFGAVDVALAALLDTPVPARDLSTKAYRPTLRATRFVRTRDQRCRFPGCRRQAQACDLDHADAWPRGSTDPANLHCLCRHHHRAKQSGLFTVHLEPDGTTVWTLRRIGRQYRNPPPDLTAT